MRTRTCLVTFLIATTTLSGCVVGPQQLRRTVDDFDQQTYVNSPWLDAALWIVPVIPVCTAGATAIDFLVTNPYHFWFEDAWDGNGTGYRHLDVEFVDGSVGSLLEDRAGWTRSQK